MPTPSFRGLRVLTLESRRAVEQATIISRLGGYPLLAPSMREIPVESQAEARAFIGALVGGGFDCVVFLTGVGTRALTAVATDRDMRDAFVEALKHVRVVARGPKPLAVLRELAVPVWMTAPEPNTWRELVAAIDARRDEFSLAGARVAVQEYGVSNPDLLEALTARGAVVTTVSIYQWALPEDLEPLRQAVDAIATGGADVIVLTSSVQLVHLWRVATEMGREDDLRRGMATMVVASIGPTTSEEIRSRGFEPDIEASSPKMGILITETAAGAGELLKRKQASTPIRPPA